MEKKKKKRLSGETLSKLNTQKSLKDVAYDKLLFVIENEVRQEPYITWVSKQQINWGNGVHWGKCKDNYFKEGLFKHAGIWRPSDSELRWQREKFGYSMDWPPPKLNDILNNVVKKRIINVLAQGRDFVDIRFNYGKGYINKDGKLDKDRGNGISGYFIFLEDRGVRNTQQEWLMNQPEWLRIQYQRCSDTYITAIMGQVESGRKKEQINQKLLSFTEYKELDPMVDIEKLTWRKNNNIK